MPSAAEVYLEKLANQVGLSDVTNYDLSGQIEVPTAGTSVRGPDVPSNGFYIKAHPDNADTVWVGNDGADVSSLSGFPLDPGETIYLSVLNLNLVYFDADSNADRICWIRL